MKSNRSAVPKIDASAQPFLSKVTELRRRAREHIEQGAVTPSYAADRQVVLNLLNDALATELVCVLRYRRHYFMADGLLAEAIKKEFLAHSTEEQAHADRIAERIVQLGGEPEFDPQTLASRSHSEYASGDTLESMIKEDLIAERVAIESYQEMITYLEGRDHTTRRLFESILSVEEQHAEELSSMLKNLNSLTHRQAGARHE